MKLRTKRTSFLVVIFGTLSLLIALAPSVALAGGGGGGVSVDTVALYQSDESTLISPGGSMDPQVEYAVKVTVTNDGMGNLSDVDYVKVTIFYDSSGTDPTAPGTSNTQTCAILTCDVGTPPSWSIDPSTSTTWVLVTANCVQPSLSGYTGSWWFHFKPGKVATESGAADDWDIYGWATTGMSTDYLYTRDYEMNWYGEVVGNTANINWGSVNPDSDFGESTKQTGISVTYIANGAYDEQVAASGPWSGNPSGTAVLDASGTPLGNEFSLKADDTATLANAVLLAVSPTYVTIDDTGVQTSESGDTVTTNTVWLKLGTPFTIATFSGSVYYKIADGS